LTRQGGLGLRGLKAGRIRIDRQGFTHTGSCGGTHRSRDGGAPRGVGGNSRRGFQRRAIFSFAGGRALVAAHGSSSLWIERRAAERPLPRAALTSVGTGFTEVSKSNATLREWPSARVCTCMWLGNMRVLRRAALARWVAMPSPSTRVLHPQRVRLRRICCEACDGVQHAGPHSRERERKRLRERLPLVWLSMIERHSASSDPRL